MKTILSVSAMFFMSLVLSAAEPKPPNIVFVLADDLGLCEIGCYGQTKIKTPNIDRMAADGLKFERFYAGNAVCAPSRCCLMTGKNPGHATIRNNVEVKPEGQTPILESDTTIASLLKKQGYTCGAIGKWGLGMFGTTGDPLTQGFDFFFGYNCQRHAHSHYPEYIYRNATRIPLPGNNLKGGDTYTHDLFDKEMLSFIDSNKAKPFFLYLPFTIPHVAVQVPEKDLEEYKGKLGDDPAYDGKKGYQPHPAPHAAYAAMVSRLDKSVGLLRAKLKELKLDDNTLVMFSSDNGGTHNVGGADSTFFESAGKLKGLKGSLYEGGIRVPMICCWPGMIKAGTTTNIPFAFWDIPATLDSLVGIKKRGQRLNDGISFDTLFNGDPNPPTHEFLYWEFSGYGGQQAVIKGDWKAVRQKLGTKVVKTELYNLKTDPNETKDVAAENAGEVKTLEAILVREHTPSTLFPLQSIDKK
ncbi:arylsulfatase [soil metagenome]